VNRNHSAISGGSNRNVAHIRCIMRLSYGTSLRISVSIIFLNSTTRLSYSHEKLKCCLKLHSYCLKSRVSDERNAGCNVLAGRAAAEGAADFSTIDRGNFVGGRRELSRDRLGDQAATFHTRSRDDSHEA